MPRYILIHLSSPLSDPDVDRASAKGEAYLDAAFGKPTNAVEHDLYKAAAVIEARDPEDLFAKTQNIDAGWTEVNPPLAGELRQRSTSVGDFIVEVDTTEVLFCARLGWEPAAGATQEKIREVAKAGFPDW